MTLQELLSHLESANVFLTLDGDRIRYRGAQDAITPDLVEGLRRHKQDLVEILRRSERATGLEAPIVAANRQEAQYFPLSFAQERMWFLDQLEPGNGSYLLIEAVRLKGDLNREALVRSVKEVVGRHEILRTTFKMSLGQPFQVISPNTIEVELADLTRIPETDQENEVQRLADLQEESCTDLENGPLFRATLIQLADRDHVLLMSMHHIVSDGWSIGVIYEELSKLYECFSLGRGPSLPELPVQYADYSVWQKTHLDDQALRPQIEAWKNDLAGPLPVLELLTDRPRPKLQTFHGTFHYISLSKSFSADLRALGQKYRCTVFMTLMAALQTLLHRYTGQTDLIVGTPVANRSRDPLPGMVGLFLNTLPIRCDLAGDPSFVELLGRVRNSVVGAFSNQDVPFERLVQVLQPERDLSRNPLFQVMLQTSPSNEPEFTGLEASTLKLQSGTAQFDLAVHLFESPQGLQGRFEYNTDLFIDETISRMVRHFQTLLESIAKAPDRPISRFPIMDEAERSEVVHRWNKTPLEYPRDCGLPDLFRQQVERTPNSVAVVAEDESLTYRELDARSNQLGHHLRESGVGPGVLVGLCVDRSAQMTVAVLGILKAGAAYVPLDPEFPSRRLAYMVEDAGIKLLITRQDLLHALPEFAGQVICMDRDRSQLADHPESSLPARIQSSDLAYVIYTSGSTGKPKGVQIEHRAVVNFLTSMADRPGLARDDVLLAVTTLSFDISVLEILLPLIRGARVVVASRRIALEGAALANLMVGSKVTVMQATPATWRLLLEAGWPQGVRPKILCGGEALPAELAKSLLGRCESLWNMYGPTETTIWSAIHRVTDSDSIPIGRPIGNTSTYVLDRHLQPVPTGVAGELYIGGHGLSRGYLGRPALTAGRFLPDPFNTPGARMYRSGDRVRMLSDGKLEFLGRIDNQIKLRGFRIELGEVETALDRHDGVLQSVAMVREDSPGDRRLVAYVVPSNGAPSIPDWQDHLRELLPYYMVPSLLVPMDELPLSPNGKIDRQSLPRPDQSKLQPEEEFRAPRDEIEERMALLWSGVLDLERVSVRANFFELGGHSLLAAKLFSRIEEAFGKRIPLATLFQKPTVQELAELLRQDDWKADWTSLVPIKPDGTRPPLFLVHGAGGNVLLYRDLAARLDDDQPVYGLQSRGLDGSGEHLTRLEEMAGAYIEEIRSLQPEGPYHMGGYCLGGTLCYEMAQQLAAQGQEVALLAMFETYNIQVETRELSLLTRVHGHVQNVRFHFGNLLSLTPPQQWRFLRTKFATVLRRLRVRTTHIGAKIGQKFERGEGAAKPHVLINKVNDDAQLKYFPKPYPGKVTLFRPYKNFAGFDDPDFGWKSLVEGELEVRELRVRPHAMLVEPFVQELASLLEDCLRHASEGTALD